MTAPAGTPGGIVLFDGTCGFCESSVLFIARRDPSGYFHFAPSQWPQAQALLAAHGLTRDSARSIVLIEGDTVFVRSTASLKIAARLTAPWRWARVLLWVPLPLRDAVYRVVAAIRHHLARPSQACEVPPPELRERLLK